MKKVQFWDEQLKRLAGWCRGLPFVKAVLIAVAVLAMMGCVATAECDAYVGCPDGAICYQSQCLPTCSNAGDCGDDEQCVPCYEDDDDTSGSGNCHNGQGNVCVDEIHS